MSFLYFPKEAICAFRVDFDLTKVVWNSEERRKVLKREIKKKSIKVGTDTGGEAKIPLFQLESSIRIN